MKAGHVGGGDVVGRDWYFCDRAPGKLDRWVSYVRLGGDLDMVEQMLDGFIALSLCQCLRWRIRSG